MEKPGKSTRSTGHSGVRELKPGELPKFLADRANRAADITRSGKIPLPTPLQSRNNSVMSMAQALKSHPEIIASLKKNRQLARFIERIEPATTTLPKTRWADGLANMKPVEIPRITERDMAVIRPLLEDPNLPADHAFSLIFDHFAGKPKERAAV